MPVDNAWRSVRRLRFVATGRGQARALAENRLQQNRDIHIDAPEADAETPAATMHITPSHMMRC
ncbi:hypothetical protein [Mycolicibacterium sp. GF69]|uniref:hypothetical protein n=1 Tax=Mycolicibacterium sp. GF69 TaxID=2267251 RepID=UPI000DD5EFB1|nr:hypothetical protein [Mycolicibacterium sp. GF69]